MRFALVSHADDLTRIDCEGDVSQHELPAARDPIEDLLGPVIFRRRVLLDLGRTSYIDSSGISYLLGAHRKFQNAGGRLVLHSAPPTVTQVFKLLKMPQVLHIAADEAEARRLASEAPA
jgi:anti-anti-sigma factor